MSQLIKQFKWEKRRNNYILQLDESHYISYNPDTRSSHFDALLDSFIGESAEETALVDLTNAQHEFRILLGDWRDDYEKLLNQGFEAMVDFFMEKRQQHGGQWSTHERDRATSDLLEQPKQKEAGDD